MIKAPISLQDLRRKQRSEYLGEIAGCWSYPGQTHAPNSAEVSFQIAIARLSRS